MEPTTDDPFSIRASQERPGAASAYVGHGTTVHWRRFDTRRIPWVVTSDSLAALQAAERNAVLGHVMQRGIV